MSQRAAVLDPRNIAVQRRVVVQELADGVDAARARAAHVLAAFEQIRAALRVAEDEVVAHLGFGGRFVHHQVLEAAGLLVDGAGEVRGRRPGCRSESCL